MLYWYTGQPGHGKTLHAIDRVLELKAEADAKHAKEPDKFPLRPLYVCNVRGFDYATTGAIELTPARWKTWADHPDYIAKRDAILSARMKREAEESALAALEQEDVATTVIHPDFENAIVLVDEAYEHGMFPKRSPSAKVPRHVERMAKHRHYGMDIVAVCQSPDTQCDAFLHDLIERHVHVRRRFGTPYVHLREFDRFEKNPEKATPLILKRGTLPKKRFGLYKSTQLDTTERRIPWYYIALPILVALALYLMYATFWNMDSFMGGEASEDAGQGASASSAVKSSRNVKEDIAKPAMTGAEYARQFLPRVPSQPWSAPVYDDKLTVPAQSPRLFCMSSLEGLNVDGDTKPPSCTCLTEQGTAYFLPQHTCRLVARNGQYEPYRDEASSGVADGADLMDRARSDALLAKGSGAAIESQPAAVDTERKNVVHARLP